MKWIALSISAISLCCTENSNLEDQVNIPLEDLVASKDIFPNDPGDEIGTTPEDLPTEKEEGAKNKKKNTQEPSKKKSS
ncbi:MAG: hypothetical protein RLZZ453_596 [Chlamydiota bacterium]